MLDGRSVILTSSPAKGEAVGAKSAGEDMGAEAQLRFGVSVVAQAIISLIEGRARAGGVCVGADGNIGDG